MSEKWVLSQNQIYTHGARISSLPRILFVHRDRGAVLDQLRIEVVRWCERYDPSRLRVGSGPDRTEYEYNSPGQVGNFFIVRSGARAPPTT